MHTNEKSCNGLIYACQIWKKLCYTMQASVILGFHHIINSNILNSPSAFLFNHCQPGKSWAHMEELNHWPRHQQKLTHLSLNILRAGHGHNHCSWEPRAPHARSPAAPHAATHLILQMQTAAKQTQWLQCDQWGSLKSITAPVPIQYKQH